MKKNGSGNMDQGSGRKKKMPDKYEVFVGNELAVQAIWKVIYPACPGEDDVACLLTNRVYSLGIPLCQLKGKSRDELIKLILIEPMKKGGNHEQAS